MLTGLLPTSLRRGGLRHLARLGAVVCALAMPTAAPAAAGCPAPEAAIGLARVVEIDASTGALYGNATTFRPQPTFLASKEVVLTFDDGPLPWITHSILDTLDHHCTKATFFTVGRMSVAYPEALRDVLRKGHTVAAHTWSHKNLRKLSTAEATDEIERGFAASEIAAGQKIAPFFRYPGLNDTRVTLEYLRDRKVATFTVDVVSDDSFISDPAQLLETTLSRIEARKGGIVLFHDIKAATAKALPRLLDELKRRGYRIVHLIAKDGFERDERYDAALKPLVEKALAKSAQPDPPRLPFYGTIPPEALPRHPGVPLTRLAAPPQTYVRRGAREGTESPVARPVAPTRNAAPAPTRNGWAATVAPKVR